MIRCCQLSRVSPICMFLSVKPGEPKITSAFNYFIKFGWGLRLFKNSTFLFLNPMLWVLKRIVSSIPQNRLNLMDKKIYTILKYSQLWVKNFASAQIFLFYECMRSYWILMIAIPTKELPWSGSIYIVRIIATKDRT